MPMGLFLGQHNTLRKDRCARGVGARTHLAKECLVCLFECARPTGKGYALKQKFTIRLLSAAVAMAVGTFAYAETLREVVQIAVETNPNIGVAAKRKDAADAAFEAAKSGYFLKLDWQTGSGIERSQNSTTLATGRDWVRMQRKIDTMVANQMLWDGLGTRSEVERRRAISGQARAHRESVRGRRRR